MASLVARTSLADERRARKLQSQALTAPRVQEENYYSSDEEEEESYQDDRAVANTTSLEVVRTNNVEAKDDSKKKKEKAELEDEYAKEEKKKKRAHRTKPTLKAPLLIDPETGLGRLLHKQPKLSKPNSTTAAASYTRKLFAHYHTAVRDWTSGNAPPNDTQWMHQVERLSSQKVVRDHVESLRQVICRRFVESKVGLEKADRYFEQLATEAAAVEPEDVEDNNMVPSPEDPESPPRPEESHTDRPARVSPPQQSRESDKVAVEEEEDEFELDSPSNKRPLPEAAEEVTAPVSKRRVLDDDDSDDEELELNDRTDNVQHQTASHDTTKAPPSKRRVLDDGSDDEAELELEDSEPKSEDTAEKESHLTEQMEDIPPVEPDAGDAMKNNTKVAETSDGHAGDAGTINKNSLEDAEMQAETARGRTDNNPDETDAGVDTLEESNEQDNASVRSVESPSNTSVGRLHVLEELTQGSPGHSQGSPSASNAMALLGQQSQPMDTQTSQDEDLSDGLMTQPATQNSLEPEEQPESTDSHPPTPSREDTTNRMAEDAEETPTQTSGSSPSEQETVVPSDSSPPEDDTVVPSCSNTQATLIAPPGTQSPTQED
eukprot:scaffold3226_cov160-Amphora_coffeaeformis.AAC.9